MAPENEIDLSETPRPDLILVEVTNDPKVGVQFVIEGEVLSPLQVAERMKNGSLVLHAESKEPETLNIRGVEITPEALAQAIEVHKSPDEETPQPEQPPIIEKTGIEFNRTPISIGSDGKAPLVALGYGVSKSDPEYIDAICLRVRHTDGSPNNKLVIDSALLKWNPTVNFTATIPIDGVATQVSIVGQEKIDGRWTIKYTAEGKEATTMPSTEFAIKADIMKPAPTTPEPPPRIEQPPENPPVAITKEKIHGTLGHIIRLGAQMDLKTPDGPTIRAQFKGVFRDGADQLYYYFESSNPAAHWRGGLFTLEELYSHAAPPYTKFALELKTGSNPENSVYLTRARASLFGGYTRQYIDTQTDRQITPPDPKTIADNNPRAPEKVAIELLRSRQSKPTP